MFFAILFGANSFCKSLAESQTTYEKYYQSIGVTGDHDLVVLNPSETQIEGSISGSGSFFLFMGGASFDGAVSSGSVIQFEWVIPTGKSQIVEVPYDMIVWDFNDRYTSPTFEFNFLQSHLSRSLNKGTETLNFNTIFEQAETITIHCTKAQYVVSILLIEVGIFIL